MRKEIKFAVFRIAVENVTEPKTAYELTKRNIISLVECSLSYNGGVRYECTFVYIMRSIMNLFIFFSVTLGYFYVVPFFCCFIFAVVAAAVLLFSLGLYEAHTQSAMQNEKRRTVERTK